jgi:hypothetical protein
MRTFASGIIEVREPPSPRTACGGGRLHGCYQSHKAVCNFAYVTGSYTACAADKVELETSRVIIRFSELKTPRICFAARDRSLLENGGCAEADPVVG